MAELPADVASSNGDQVVVVLYLQDQSPLIPKRRLTLTRDCPVARIGRSSKVHSKGFIPTSENAWFDNPVMSREHAEITVKFDESPVSVYLRDIGSFHGTYHRGSHLEVQLVPQQEVKLNNNDIIRFGMEIIRADKTYPPCSVRFETEMPISKSDIAGRRSFTVPDDIDDMDDIDDEEDEHETESAIERIERLQADWEVRVIKTLPITTPKIPEPKGVSSMTPKIPEPVSSINSRSFVDLTIDDDSQSPVANCCNTNSDTIDLTSEPNCDSDVKSYSGLLKAALQPRVNVTQGTNEVVDPVSLMVPSDDDLVDEDVESVASKDNMSPSPSIDILSDSGASSVASSAERFESRSLDPDSTLSESENYAEYRFGPESHGGLHFYPYDDSSDGSSVDEDYDENEDDFDEDDESLSDDANSDDDDHDDESDDASTESDDRVSQDVLSVTAWRLAKSIQSYNRHPSPSDAALIKSNRPRLNNVPDESRAQQLGEKTGKFEYFAAREQNRAAISQHHAPAPISAIRETLQSTQCNVVTPEVAKGPRSPSPTLSCVPDKECDDGQVETTSISKGVDDIAPCTSETADAMSIKLGDTDTNQYSAWAVSGDKFINNPLTEEPSSSQTIIVPAGELDMTSAFKFQQSKHVSSTHETRRLLIQDLLEGEPKPSVNQDTQASIESNTTSPSACELATDSRTPIKRSYEEAFEQDENDESLLARDQAEVTLEKPDAFTPQTKVADVPVAIATHAERCRPTKRMRLAAAAKVAACVALGGAATFSYLVNTAPVF
ncbi:hypothetical protein F5Y08DRAFT_305653 [Xylaria arbuscula]|nr:hypothetical protein F5Y08DRAFT_305653 [Xylaria arbuscula]